MSSVNDRLKAIYDRVRPTPRWKQINLYVRQKYNSLNFATFLASGREANKLIFASKVEVALLTSDWSDIDAVTGPLNQIRDEPVEMPAEAKTVEPSDEEKNVVAFPGVSPTDGAPDNKSVEKETVDRIARAIEDRILRSPALEKIIDARVQTLLLERQVMGDQGADGK
jgi:pyruvate/2-oxoglutarate dehydrogenase complex dihydrolipoamide acyltransferase (E2) component